MRMKRKPIFVALVGTLALLSSCADPISSSTSTSYESSKTQSLSYSTSHTDESSSSKENSISPSTESSSSLNHSSEEGSTSENSSSSERHSSSENHSSSEIASSSKTGSTSSSEAASSESRVEKKATIDFGSALDSSGNRVGNDFSSYYRIDGEIRINNNAVATNVFSPSYGKALRFGSSSGKGSLTITLDKTYSLYSATLYTSPFGSDQSPAFVFKAGNYITSSTTVSSSNQASSFHFSSNTNTIAVEGTNQRFYLHKIELDYYLGGSLSSSESSSSSSESSSSSSSSSRYSSSSSSDSSHGSSLSTSTGAGSYYDSINWSKSGAALKSDLSKLIGANYVDLGYDGALRAYKTTDTDENGKIIDIYSKYRWSVSDSGGNYKKEGDCYNREHTVPQSVFNKGSPMVSDVHHLFPTDGYVNNQRGNYPHGYVSSWKYKSTNDTKVGSSDSNKNHGYSGTVCEVPDEYKGDIARAYFYMVTRYETKLPSWKNYDAFDGKTFPAMKKWAINTYLEWNDLDPVSEKEIKRNNAIYALQKNRNPFVDHPEAAHKIWDSSR